MAARYAVATGNWTGAIWAATVGGAAGSAAVPTNADDVTINKNVVVTLDATTCVALSVTLSVGTTGADVGGQLTPSTSASSKLTVEGSMTGSGASGGSGAYSGYYNFDMSGAAAYTCEVVLNNVRATGAGNGLTMAGNWTLKGAAKTRSTTLSGAVSIGASTCTVAVASGWCPGDAIVFATTSAYNATPKTDILVLDATYTPGSTSLIFSATPDTTVNPGAVATFVNAHASGCPVGNLRSNLIFRPGTAGDIGYVVATGTTANMSVLAVCSDVEFRGQTAGSGQGNNPLGLNATTNKITTCSNNAFYDFRSLAIYLRSLVGVITRQNNIFYTTSNAACLGGQDVSGSATIGSDEDYVIFRAGGSSSNVIVPLFAGQHQYRHKISGVAVQAQAASGAILNTNKAGIIIDHCDIWSCNSGVTNSLTALLNACRFGSVIFSGCDNTTNLTTADGVITATDCQFPATFGRTGASSLLPSAKVQVVNKNADATVQEIYGAHSNTVPMIVRSAVAAEYTRSTSALVMTCNATTAITQEITIPARSGAALRILLYAAKSGVNAPVSGDVAYGASTLPSATLSGLGITPITATLSGGTAAGTFELLAIDLAAGSAPASDGNLTLTLTAQSATAGARAFFAGCPAMPFVSRARHYGYLFDETTPIRTLNTAVTVSAATPALPSVAELVASEATANAIGGITVSWGSSSSITAFAADKTFQQLYDYTQAQACLNVASALPVTGAGVAGSPALFAAGNITVSTGKKLNGSGSLSMGSYALSTEFASAVAYTYTGGTFSQAAATPSFSGGTLTLPTAITTGGDFSMTGATIEFGAASALWDLGDVTFSGTITLATTAGQAVTVAMPSGTTITNSEPGNITVTTPVVTADISITGMPVAGSEIRLQIKNATAESASAWVANTVYATGAIVKRSTGLGTESTKGLYMRATTGGTSHATTEPTWDTTVGNTTADNTVTWTTYAVLYYDADPVATSLTDSYVDGEEFLAGESADIRFAEMATSVSFKVYDTTVITTAAGFSALVSEDEIPEYATFGLDGSAQEATFSPNFGSNYMVLDANLNFAGKAAFAYYCYTLTTSSGMANFWGGITALDAGNLRVNTAILDLYFDETAGFVRQTDDVRIFRDDGARPALDPTTGGSGIEMNWRTPVSVVTTGDGPLTSEQAVQLMAIPTTAAPTAATVATAVWSKTLPL